MKGRRPGPDSRHYTTENVDRDWMCHAACRGQDPELWFPPRVGTVNQHDRRQRRRTQLRTRYAQETCQECPVQSACLHYALITDARYGIYGGTTEADRARLSGRRVFG